ncbi:hypothetical protein D3C84_1251950 [compost metagenome]
MSRIFLAVSGLIRLLPGNGAPRRVNDTGSSAPRLVNTVYERASCNRLTETP